VTPSLITRLRWSRQEVVASIEATDPSVVARSFVYLFGLGGIFAALVPVLPGGQLVAPGFLIAAVAIAFLTAAAVLVAYDRVPRWAVRLLAPLGTTLVTLCVLSIHPASAPVYGLLYFWSILAASYFYGMPTALLDLGLVAVQYAVALTVRDVDQGLMLWLMTMATLTVVGVMLALLRKRADTLILTLDTAARTDALTALLNRRGFETVLGDELARCRRTGRVCALLIVDADGFKNVNDRWGHPVGDAVLRYIADTLHDGRRTDRTARLGGDEFALLLPETGRAGAELYAERMLAELDEGEGVPDEVAGDFSVSVGIACFPADGDDEVALQSAADVALYQAKQRGGARAVVFETWMGGDCARR